MANASYWFQNQCNHARRFFPFKKWLQGRLSCPHIRTKGYVYKKKYFKNASRSPLDNSLEQISLKTRRNSLRVTAIRKAIASESNFKNSRFELKRQVNRQYHQEEITPGGRIKTGNFWWNFYCTIMKFRWDVWGHFLPKEENFNFLKD